MIATFATQASSPHAGVVPWFTSLSSVIQRRPRARGFGRKDATVHRYSLSLNDLAICTLLVFLSSSTLTKSSTTHLRIKDDQGGGTGRL
jgi:hypothetical protein